MEEKLKQIIDITEKLLQGINFDPGSSTPEVVILAGDGSQRTFYRLHFDNGQSLVAIVPGKEQEKGQEEAISSWLIGNHLYRKGLPVPELLAFDTEHGFILTEDLGDVRLYEYVCGEGGRERKDIIDTYKKVVQHLVKLQVEGSKEFDSSWCWQTPRYDRQLMLERESGYFVDALCRNYLQVETDVSLLQNEFEDIADNASRAPSDFFLHRDFQSRNIMLKNNKVCFIDYQGGRFGPLGYDLASLLIDPYVQLPSLLQEEMLQTYVDKISTSILYDPDQFRHEFYFLSIQRNLQILGAFAFLSNVRNKEFFRPYIRPALISLKSLLANPLNRDYPALYTLTKQCLEKADTYDI